MLAGARTAAREAKAVAIPRSVGWLRADVVWSLARVEAKRLLLGPAFYVTIGLVGLLSMVSVFGVIGDPGEGGDGPNLGALIGLGACLGVLLATPIAVNASAVRADREGLREQFGVAPSSPETRTIGLFGGLALGPVVLLSMVLAVATPFFRDATETASIGLLVQVPLVGLALGSIAIGFGRWIRYPVGGVLIIVLHVFTPLIWALPWIVEGNEGWDLEWHFGYLVAQVALWLSIALAGDRRRLTSAIAPVICLGLVIICAMQRIPAAGME